MIEPRARAHLLAGCLALCRVLWPGQVHAQEALPPPTQDIEAAPAQGGDAPPSSLEDPSVPDAPASQDGLLDKPLGPGTGPGLPWPVVLALQLLAYTLADTLPFFTCVACSWATSFLIPFGPGLPLAIFLSVLFIPPAAVLSGCFSAALLQFLGDRLGIQRGRLACVGVTSVGLSFVTYAFVIAPIIVGMGFFTVALASFLSTTVLVALPDYRPPGPSWLYSALGYSFSAVGVTVALAALALGGILAPALGFILRPALVAMAYRLTGRPRESGEEQWPPSLFGERPDKWMPWRNKTEPAPPPKKTATQVAPPVEAPATPSENPPTAMVGVRY